MTQQERKYPVQDQDLLDAMAEAYRPQVVRERDLLDAAIEASEEDEVIDLAQMQAILDGIDEPDPDAQTRRKIRFCAVCGEWNCDYHPIEVEI